jgi:hypothetical protein
MFKKMVVLSVLLVLFCAGGCAPQEFWAQPGVTLEQCKKDLAECEYLRPPELKGLI